MTALGVDSSVKRVEDAPSDLAQGCLGKWGDRLEEEEDRGTGALISGVGLSPWPRLLGC